MTSVASQNLDYDRYRLIAFQDSHSELMKLILAKSDKGAAVKTLEDLIRLMDWETVMKKATTKRSEFERDVENQDGDYPAGTKTETTQDGDYARPIAEAKEELEMLRLEIDVEEELRKLEGELKRVLSAQQKQDAKTEWQDAKTECHHLETQSSLYCRRVRDKNGRMPRRSGRMPKPSATNLKLVRGELKPGTT